ncbi:hypothetical protein GGR50DRAFT_682154 [Xylaria sp. CBS 124048]|nr:hypothetical protein GGR50DRAFT_682154 [Xylaria sp. CBS 124048]
MSPLHILVYMILSNQWIIFQFHWFGYLISLFLFFFCTWELVSIHPDQSPRRRSSKHSEILCCNNRQSVLLAGIIALPSRHPMENSSNGARASPSLLGAPGGRRAPQQKRVRNYGEELKGLSSSDEDECHHGESAPASKRRMLSGSTDTGAKSRSESAGLDDGEILEPCLASSVAQRAMTAPSPNMESKPFPKTPGAPASVSSEDEETNAKGHRANSSVSRKPRASLPGTSGAMEEPDKPSSNEERKRPRPRDPVSSFEACKETWNFPLTAPVIVVPAGISEHDDVWMTVLRNWVTHLLQANEKAADRLTFKTIRAGWPIYFSKKMGFLRGSNKESISIRAAAHSFMASLAADVMTKMITEARGNSPIPGNSPAHEDSPAEARSSEEELRLQRKYFPGVDDPSQLCLSCSGIGHTSPVCPELNCRFCEKRHNSFGCPTRQRCDKCRQVGHSIDNCREKLALAPDEVGGCAFCGAKHKDEECYEIWRSFKPSELNTKKVKNIPMFCYVCGSENHYGPECSAPDRNSKTSENTTWSKENRERYIDPESEDVAIAWDTAGADQAVGEDIRIMGRATRTLHTYFVSSDESEEDFIHEPVTKPKTRGRIQIASSIGQANGNSRGRGRGNANNIQSAPRGHGQTPTKTGSTRATHSTPNNTLPPRPETFTHGKTRGGSNSRFHGRGGYRGRGRGRGRGK